MIPLPFLVISTAAELLNELIALSSSKKQSTIASYFNATVTN